MYVMMVKPIVVSVYRYVNPKYYSSRIMKNIQERFNYVWIKKMVTTVVGQVRKTKIYKTGNTSQLNFETFYICF
jgi:hypothetical protein